jgi:hypothetical protein
MDMGVVILVVIGILVGVIILSNKKRKDSYPQEPTVVTSTVPAVSTIPVSTTVYEPVTIKTTMTTPIQVTPSKPEEPVVVKQPEVVQPEPVKVPDWPTNAYGNWQSFRFASPTEPWQEAFNLLANKDPITALLWGFTAGNPIGEDLKRAVDAWHFGSAMNPVTGNSWPNSLGNKLVEVFNTGGVSMAQGYLGFDRNWTPPDAEKIRHLLMKHGKMAWQTDEQYSVIPGISPEEWNTPKMLERFQ